MISGRSSDTTYEQTEYLNPGYTSSVTAAPPRTGRRSSTRTFRPARARYAAWGRPLWPPPMTRASYLLDMGTAIISEWVIRESAPLGETCRPPYVHESVPRVRHA